MDNRLCTFKLYLQNNLSAVYFALFLHDANIFSSIAMFVIRIEILMAAYSGVFESCSKYGVKRARGRM